MDKLFDKYQKNVLNADTNFIRGLMYEIKWESRLIGIRGARGV